MPITAQANLEITITRSQLAYRLGYGRAGGGINWAGFYAYIEEVLGDNWETKYNIRKGQRVFNTVQTKKILSGLELI